MVITPTALPEMRFESRPLGQRRVLVGTLRFGITDTARYVPTLEIAAIKQNLPTGVKWSNLTT